MGSDTVHTGAAVSPATAGDTGGIPVERDNREAPLHTARRAKADGPSADGRPGGGTNDAPFGRRNGGSNAGAGDAGSGGSGCTAPQLRRFIKSRSWVPMHELRRRFGINGAEDDVTGVAIDGTTIFVGLPNREADLLGELFRAGDIGYELSLDPETPIVIGVYPMRPVPRH